jgi:hypothetical protein
LTTDFMPSWAGELAGDRLWLLQILGNGFSGFF